MSDSELRALDRRWRETGAAEDEGRWLAERVRAGELEGAWLDALAFFGHEAAVLAGGKAADPWDLDDANVWGMKLRPLGVPIVVRAAFAAAWLGVEPWERAHPGQAARGPRRALEAVEAWLACPCQQHALAAREASEFHDDDPIEVDDDDDEVELPVRWAITTAGRVGRALPTGTVVAATQALHEVARLLRKNVERPAVLAAIRDALVATVRGSCFAPGAPPGPLRRAALDLDERPSSSRVLGTRRRPSAQVHGSATAPAGAPPPEDGLALAARTYLALLDGGADAAALARARAALVAAAASMPPP